MATAANKPVRGADAFTSVRGPELLARGAVDAAPELLGSGYEHDASGDVWADPSLDNAPAAPAAPPMFHVGRVQHAFSAPLVQMHAAANHLTILLAPVADDTGLRIVRIGLGESPHTSEAEVPPNRARGRTHAVGQPEASAPRLFVDKTANHVLVSVGSDNYYWTPGWARAQLLPKLSGVVVTSAAWTPPDELRGAYTLPPPAAHAHWLASGHVLLGTATGAIFEALLATQVSNNASGGDLFDRLARFGSNDIASSERFVHHMHTIDGSVTGLAVHVDGQRATVLATTATRLHEFSGRVGHGDSSSAFGRLFAPYLGPGVTSLRTELPGRRDHTALVVRRVPTLDGGHCASAAWLTDAGVYRATIQPTQDPALRRADMIPLPVDAPHTLLCTEWHLVFASDNAVCCTRTLDHKAVFDTTLPLAADERILGVTADTSNGTYWLYTDTNIFEIIVTDEGRDIWRVFVDRHEYDHALRHARTPSQTELVHARHADTLIEQQRYLDAACELAQTARNFESVVLSFIDAGADDALREYVALRLSTMRGRTQRLVLATWLADMSLSKLNAAEAAGSNTADAAAALRGLLCDYRTSLDPKTTLSLIARHGRADIWFYYARLVGDYEAIVSRLVLERRWEEAIAALGQQSSLQLYYQFSGVLMRHAPAAVTEAWMRNDALDIRPLIPALLQHKPRDGEVNYSIRFLEHATKQCADHAVHNLLLTLLAERAASSAVSGDRAVMLAPLLSFIESRSLGTAFFDPDYALRMCARKGLREACVRLYAAMDLYEDAVDLALESGDVDLACRCADRAHGSTSQKELWLKIARHVVDTQDMHAAMAFLQRTSLLSIEDILPFFPDFSVIDDVKTEICETLENYVERIDTLKSDMDRMALTAGHIQDDIQALSRRFLLIDPDQRCIQCAAPLSLRHLYIFPCRHGFHADCLVTEVTRHLPPRLLRRLLQLQDELAAIDGKSRDETQVQNPTGFPVFSNTARVGATVASGLGSLKLDRLREHVRPEAIVEAIGIGLSAGMASGRRVLAPLDPFAEPRVRQRSTGPHGHLSSTDAPTGPNRDTNTLARSDALRAELNTIVAGACPVCTLTVHQLTMPFVGDSGAVDEDDWAI